MERRKYKYEVYDYSKIGIPKTKIFFRETISNEMWNRLNEGFFSPNDTIKMITDALKEKYAQIAPQYYGTSNYEFEWEVITPDKVWTSYEASY